MVSKGLEIKFLRARAAQKRGDNAEAERLYSEVLKVFPNNIRARKGMDALQQRATSEGPEESPPKAEVWALLNLYSGRRLTEAIELGENMLAQYPRSFILHELLAKANNGMRCRDRAADWFRKALQIEPENAEAHYDLGATLQALGRMDEAIASYDRAIEIKPNHVEAHRNRGAAMQALGRMDEAIACYERTLRFQPDHAETHNNLGVVLQRVGRLDEAIASYGRACRIKPDFAAAWAQKLHLMARICDWDALDADRNLIPDLGVSGSAVPPFTMLAFDDDPARQRSRGEKFAAEMFPPSNSWTAPRPAARPDRLRIGYFSADFHNHATMYLLAGMFEHHDRERFEIHAFSYGPDQRDEMRQRLVDAVEKFHDVRSMGSQEVTELARLQGIDVAVDLKGYTGNARLDMFALRLAPVQMTYMGFPGTLGAPFIDYTIADRVVIPEPQRHHYSGKIIFLPDSYYVNDDRKPISERAITRAEMGLPDRGFIFCCFNNNYKISAEEFDIWMRLLHRVEGSVLWLLRANRWSDSNLRKQAEKRGIDAGRLVFADRMPLPEHLARHRLADLFLDTFRYNAHTTASDALWTGLPVLTKVGKSFAARVAASELMAIGLPEMITTTADDYERLAVDLAENPQKLSRVRARLASNRRTTPLFDTELFTRGIEAGYEQAYGRYFENRPPADIWVRSR